MRHFASQILKPYILGHKYQNILEIGSSRGQNADQLLKGNPKIKISVIDPCVHRDLIEKYKNNPRVNLLKGLSLEILPQLRNPFDCILIDGDHNYYTVLNELEEIHRHGLLKNSGTIFLHDVRWPYARRDMYYDPANIPKEHLFSYAQRGMARGRRELVDEGGFNAGANNALYEGGPRNGVLTAVEDFLRPNNGQYVYYASNSQYGLGVIIKKPATPPLLSAWYWRVKLFDLKTTFRLAVKRLKSVTPALKL